MKQIYEQANALKQFLPKQSVDKKSKYRRNFYLVECPVEDGSLLLNTLTYELLFLNHDELKALNNPDIDNENIRYLIERFFLVTESTDDKTLADQIINTGVQIQNIYTNPPLSYFVILTTTGCNARCFYCFEKGAKISNMTAQTAHDVANFIIEKGTKKVKIQWFGGEPLCNMKAIDIISKELKEKNIEFSSRMVTNGYLLDEKVIEKAVDLWKLDTLQITLDGTEEVYNKIKNYVYKDVSSPFIRVLNNIENALKAGMIVSIRLNMDKHNMDDLFNLTHLLIERFNQYNNCHIYVVRLFEDTCSNIKNRDVGDRHKLIEASVKLQNIIDENMPLLDIKELPKSVDTPNTCMACNDNSVMIVPDGHLGKCEHFVDSDFYGSIYSDEKDIAKIQKYKERTIVCEGCLNCNYRGVCHPLKCCTGRPTHCDDIDKIAVEARLFSKLRNIYNTFTKLEKENKR